MKRMLLFFATLWLGIMGASAQRYHYDVNNDGEVNINDAVALVNNILGKENSGEVEGLEEVDLGLPSGTIWANINIGASKPEEYGNYFAWGETKTKDAFTRYNYQYYKNGSYVDIGSDISGTQYDVATALWGGNWCMPTIEQFEELTENCNYEWTTVNGVNGGKFASKINGSSIFLPAAGMYWNNNLEETGNGGNYWSSTQYPSSQYNIKLFYFESGYANAQWYSTDRLAGLSVRPVRPGKNCVPAKAIDLGLPSGTKWANCNVGATKPEEDGEYFAWGELNKKHYYSEDTYLFYMDGEYMYLGDDISGTKYDVARQRWGGNWRMPTKDEIQELIDNCNYECTTYQGCKIGKFTSKINGNSIFLPFGDPYIPETVMAGCSFYWSSTLNEYDSGYAYTLLFDSGYNEWYGGENGPGFAGLSDSSRREGGQLVRPVIRN